jgi:hypothetical protein
MSSVKISIEVRIDADSESEARQYAATHGIDVNNAKWHPNSGGKDGRLYAVATIPFPTPKIFAPSSEMPQASAKCSTPLIPEVGLTNAKMMPARAVRNRARSLD